LAEEQILRHGEARRDRFFYGYAVVMAAFLIMVVTQGMLYSFGVFFKPLSAEFGWTRAVTSGAFSLSTILKGALYILTGRLNDRIGPRAVMTGCGLFLGLAYLLMSHTNAIWHLYLFYGVMVAVGMSGGFVPMLSTVSRWFVRRRGLMVGIVAAGSGLGTLIVPPLANWLISSYDWRTSYAIMGAAALVIIVVAAQFMKRDPSRTGRLPHERKETSPATSEHEASGFLYAQAVRTGQFRVLTVAAFALGLCHYIIMVHIVPHATDLGMSTAGAASILAAIGIANVAGKVLAGGAGDRLGSKKASVLCFALASCSLVVLLLADSLWAFYLFAGIFGFAVGGLLSLLALLVADQFGLRSHGVILGSVVFALDIGGAVGPTLAGYIFDVTGSYQPAFLFCLGVSITGLVVTALLRPPMEIS